MSQLEIVRSFLAEETEKQENYRILHQLAGCEENGVESYLLTLLCDPEEKLGQLAAKVLFSRNPYLKLTRRVAAMKPVSSLEYGAENEQRWQELITTGLSDFIKMHGDNVSAYIPLTHFPALHQLLVERLEEAGLSAVAKSFARLVNLNQEQERRELIFVPTYLCNLSCPYCYAKNWHHTFGGSATRETIVRLLDWAQTNFITTISLAGGEPTVFRDFAFLTEELRSRTMKLTMASNLLFSPEIGAYLQPELVDFVTAHYDQEYIGNSGLHDRYCRNFAELCKKKISARIRYTLTVDSNPDEWGNILDLCADFAVDSIHFSLTFLNYDRSNTRPFGENELERKITLMGEFCEDALSRKVRPVLCKPVPLCYFSPERMKKYLLEDILQNGCVAMDAHYSRNITVNPDLSIFPCNGLARKGPEITGFASLQEAGSYFKKFISGLEARPFFPQCSSCFYGQNGLCQQACLVEKIQTEIKRPEPV